jgi:CubicO group peptidase (beta-lactamase class C family)
VPPAVEIHGHHEPRYARVVDAFRENFTARNELGAGFTVMEAGEVVVDLWAGWADAERTRPWTADTAAPVFSVTKGMVALAFLMLEDRGEIDLDAPVARWWPEFAAHGKAAITVRQLLNHRAGLCAVDAPLTLDRFARPEDFEPALVAQRPLWEPGEAQGYGATAFGMYTAALFRRVAGVTLGAWLQREVFGPLGVNAWLGLPAAPPVPVATLVALRRRELLRTAAAAIPRQWTLEGRIFGRFLLQRGSETARALRNPDMGERGLASMNDPKYLALELPWMNLVTSSRALATVYGALAQGGELGDVALVGADALDAVTRRQSWAWTDRVMQKPMGFSQGFVKEEPHLFSPNEAAFGHPGTGGALGMADPTHKLGFGFVLNRLDPAIRSPRALALCHAVYRSLGYG